MIACDFDCFMAYLYSPNRYIEIFRSSVAEMKRQQMGGGRPGPYDKKDRGASRGNMGGGGGGGSRNGRGEFL